MQNKENWIFKTESPFKLQNEKEDSRLYNIIFSRDSKIFDPFS